MRAIGGADRLEMRIVLQIVVAIGQAEPALAQMRDVDRGIVLVGTDLEEIGRAYPQARQVRE
jgi:hypothetical protein